MPRSDCAMHSLTLAFVARQYMIMNSEIPDLTADFQADRELLSSYMT